MRPDFEEKLSKLSTLYFYGDVNSVLRTISQNEAFLKDGSKKTQSKGWKTTDFI